jgi:long-chain fatty acid transport protein
MDLQRINRRLALAAGLTVASLASGAGFTILEQSVSGIGGAFAGGAATASDASTAFFNPAGMSYLDSAQVQAETHYLMLNAYFTNKGTTTTTSSGSTVATSGGNSEGGFKTPVPSAYFVQPLGHGLTLGFSMNCPFGLGTEYDSDWAGRYMAIKSQITTVDMSPSIAWRVTDKLSIGAGMDCYYIDANLTSAIDFGRNGTSTFDGFTNMKADDDAYGYHLGVIYQVTDSTRIGVAYRSQVTTHLKGTVDFTVPANYVAYLNSIGYGSTATYIQSLFADQGVGAVLKLPASASLSVVQSLNDKIDLLADVTWTDWSTFYSLDLNFENAATEAYAGKAQIENWRDTFRYSTGLTYKWSDTLKLRMGLCYDEAAVRSAYYRTPRIPDAKRYWIATGLSWQLSTHSTLDAAYVHIFVADPDVDNSIHTSNEHVVGTINASMDIVSLAYTYSF